jgi:hypothetical protein
VGALVLLAAAVACEGDGGGATGVLSDWSAAGEGGRVVEAGSSGFGAGPTGAAADDGGAAVSADLRGRYRVDDHEVTAEDCTELTPESDYLVGKRMEVTFYQEGADLYAVFRSAEPEDQPPGGGLASLLGPTESEDQPAESDAEGDAAADDGRPEPMEMFGSVAPDGTYRLAATRRVTERGSEDGVSYTVAVTADILSNGRLAADGADGGAERIEGAFTLDVDVTITVSAQGRTQSQSMTCHIETAYRGARTAAPGVPATPDGDGGDGDADLETEAAALTSPPAGPAASALRVLRLPLLGVAR